MSLIGIVPCVVGACAIDGRGVLCIFDFLHRFRFSSTRHTHMGGWGGGWGSNDVLVLM